MGDRNWQKKGACIRHDPELFHPMPRDYKGIARAKAICNRCPVRAQCLEHALTHGESGVWGGTTEDERRGARRSGRAA